MSEAIDLSRERGLAYASAFWDPTGTLHLGAAAVALPDVFAGAYGELGLVRPIRGDLEARLDTQFTYESPIGDRLLGADLAEGPILNAYGSSPSYTNLMQRVFDRANEKALLASLSYDFSFFDLDAVSFIVNFAAGFGGELEGRRGDVQEVDVTLDYRLTAQPVAAGAGLLAARRSRGAQRHGYSRLPALRPARSLTRRLRRCRRSGVGQQGYPDDTHYVAADLVWNPDEKVTLGFEYPGDDARRRTARRGPPIDSSSLPGSIPDAACATSWRGFFFGPGQWISGASAPASRVSANPLSALKPAPAPGRLAPIRWVAMSGVGVFRTASFGPATDRRRSPIRLLKAP
jgi:hypothetical protein